MPITLVCDGDIYAAVVSVILPAAAVGLAQSESSFGLIAKRGGVFALVGGMLLHLCYFLYAVCDLHDRGDMVSMEELASEATTVRCRSCSGERIHFGQL